MIILSRPVIVSQSAAKDDTGLPISRQSLGWPGTGQQRAPAGFVKKVFFLCSKLPRKSRTLSENLPSNRIVRPTSAKEAARE
jgi:hypothetical protein